MQLADRYISWLRASQANRLAETPPLLGARQIPDVELQALWIAGEFGREFVTTTGERVRVEHFGDWNRDPGPPFAGAQMIIAGVKVRGGVEVHADARAWRRHAAGNPDPENTILHVFALDAKNEGSGTAPQPRRPGDGEIPVVFLDVSRFAFLPVDPPPRENTACRGAFAALPAARVLELVEAAAQYRLCRKAARLERLAEQFDPQEALYQAIAEALGYRNNKLPFTLLAQRFPLALLRSNRAEIEPLLFAASGFLNATDLSPLAGDTRTYLRDIWTQWWPRRSEFERLTLPASLWTLRGLRPVNHPQRRVAALAEIVRNWPVVETLSRAGDVTAIRHYFEQLAHPYWDFHYTLTSKRSPGRMALVGESRITDLLLNIFLPRALSSAPAFWQACRELPAADPNQRVELAARRLFGASAVGRRLGKRALTQQGLLQIYEDFCLACDADCTRCAMPSRLECLEPSPLNPGAPPSAVS